MSGPEPSDTSVARGDAESASPTKLPPEPGTFSVQVATFEGPLDLLLHLIRKHELDILDIPIAFITDAYREYLEAMRRLDLGVAGEYLVMAATLLQIKSRLLLPDPEEEDEEGDPLEDPRAALVRRLLEYERFREVADELGSRRMLGRDVFRRPSRADRYREAAGPGEVIPVELFRLLEAFHSLVDRRGLEPTHVVAMERFSLRDAIGRIADVLAEAPRTNLRQILYSFGGSPSRIDVVVTFLALLEMARLRLVRLLQSRLSVDELIVERAVIDPDEVALDLFDDPERAEARARGMAKTEPTEPADDDHLSDEA